MFTTQSGKDPGTHQSPSVKLHSTKFYQGKKPVDRIYVVNSQPVSIQQNGDEHDVIDVAANGIMGRQPPPTVPNCGLYPVQPVPEAGISKFTCKSCPRGLRSDRPSIHQ